MIEIRDTILEIAGLAIFITGFVYFAIGVSTI